MRKYFWLPALFFLVACSAPAGPTTPPPDAATAAATVAVSPSPTTEPLALMVNGEGIPKRVFEAELARLQDAQAAAGLSADLQAQTAQVAEYLIAQTLLAQGAREAGLEVSPDELDARLDALRTALQPDGLEAWMTANHYTLDLLRDDLERDLLAAAMRDKILANVPAQVEQVHVFQILLYNEEDAQAALARLDSGADFLELAAAYDPQTGGDLGWLPAGALFSPAAEAAVWMLEEGTYSQVVESPSGFHIFYLAGRETRPLVGDMRLLVAQRYLENWLAEKRAAAEVIFAP